MRKSLFAVLAAALLLAAELFCPGPWAAEAAVGKKHLGGLADAEIISAEDLRKKQLRRESFILLDARNKRSYDEAHIPGARLPQSKEYYRKEELFRLGTLKKFPDARGDLKRSMSRYPATAEIITYCNAHCQASVVLLFEIKKLGFSNVRVLEEGLQGWEEKGYPLVKNRTS